MSKSLKRFSLTVLLLAVSFSFLFGEENNDSLSVAKFIEKAENFVNQKQGFDSAVFYLKNALHMSGKSQRVYILNGLMLSYYNLKDIDSTKKYGFLAIQYSERELSSLDENYITALNNLGAIRYRIGDYNGAREIFLTSLKKRIELFGEVNESILSSYNNLGFISIILGDFNEAERYIGLTIKKYPELVGELSYPLGNAYLQMGSLFFKKEDFRMSIKFHKKAYSILVKLEKINTDNYAIDLQQYLAKAYLNLGHIDSAKQAIERVKTYNPDLLGFQWGINNQIFAKIAYAERDYTSELLHRKKVIDYFVELFSGRESHPELAINYKDLGDAYLHNDSLSEAIESYNYALSMAFGMVNKFKELLLPDSVRYPHNAIPILNAKAEALIGWYEQTQDLEKLRSAYDSYFLSTQLIDRLRKGFRSAGSKLLLSEDAVPTYEAALKTGWRLYELTGENRYLEELIVLMEQNKASLLLENLKESEIKSQLGVPDSLLEAERDLRIDIAYYKKLLYEETEKTEGQDSSLIAGWKEKIFEKEEALRQMAEYLAETYPEYHQLKFQTYRASVADIRERLLERNDLMVEYFWGDSSLLLLAIDQKEIRFHQIDDVDQLEGQLLELRQLLNDRSLVLNQGNSEIHWRAITDLSHQLYQDLVAPVIGGKEYEQLLIIPDGLLSTLPFDLLLEEAAGSTVNYRAPAYLLKRYGIYYAYSASLILQQADQKREAEEYYAGFAPAFGQTNFYAESRSYVPLDSGARSGFAPLLFNQEEVKGIADLVQGRSWLAEAATESHFKSFASSFNVLHLATHAFTNDEDPNLSGLVFTPNQLPDTQAIENDGILHAYEIYDMKLNADLAVLSACNTGIGKLARGEGVMSLARAFTYAGCPSLLMSLWQADDEATGALMQSFYQFLEAGHTKAEAVRLAKLAYLKTSDKPHPHFWSTFVMIGDNQPMHPHPWKKGLWLMAALLAVALSVYGVRAYAKK